MFVNPILELSMVLDNDRFQKLLSKKYNFEENDEECIDRVLSSKGLTVTYRNSRYKKKVKLMVNPYIMLGDNKFDSKKFVRNLSKLIDEYFVDQYQISDFKLSKTILTADIDVHSRENVSAYLKVLQRIGRVKGFSPVTFDCFDKGTSFCLEGNSNGIEFLIYDLEKTLLGQLEAKSADRKKISSMIEKTKGVLRGEVRLTSSKSIQNYTDTTDISEQIREISDKCGDIFFEIFAQIVPFGDFYKKDKATEIIHNNVENRVLRRKMIQLVALVPEKKSLWLAQKAMNCRDMERIMEEFAKMNLAPVTLSKRTYVKNLNSIYSYMIFD